MSLSSLLVEKSFADLPGWEADDHLPAYEAFRRSAFHVLTKPYRTGSLGVRFDAFAGAYDEARSEKIQSSFVGINKADIVSAEMKGGEAHVTLRIVSELISATRDGAGAVIDGDPETVAEVKDVWTFSRDTRSKDPNWKLVATEEED